jgi:hypothetical protein
MNCGASFTTSRWTLPVAKKELRQPMPRTQLILLGRFPLPDKIAQSFGVFIRTSHRGEISGTVTSGSQLK